MKKGILIVLSLFLGGTVVMSQKSGDELVKVSGTVTAFEHFYVKNAEVSAKKTKSKALTDSLGRFEIMARKGDALIFSANGFEKNRRKVTGSGEPMNVNLILMEGAKHRKVAVGYGHLSEKDLTYALHNYSNLNNDYLKYTDMKDLLSRELVGVKVVDQGGIKVYSQGSQNVMNSNVSSNTGEALFVVDGVIVPSIDYLQPRDIKSVRMLKGAEASIYGSRSANGVVLIETR
jgi:TonB-dependent SusC/RagA subfamily outer membrane receptor